MKKLKFYRIKKGLSQTALGRLSTPPVSQTHVGALERGLCHPASPTLAVYALARVLGVEPAELLDEVSDPLDPTEIGAKVAALGGMPRP